MSYLIIELETQLLKTGKTSSDLIRATGHTPANISKLRNGKIKAIRLKTLLEICDELDCQPGDIIQRVSEKELEELIVVSFMWASLSTPENSTLSLEGFMPPRSSSDTPAELAFGSATVFVA